MNARYHQLAAGLITAVLGLGRTARPQDEPPVRISFDRDSARIDIVTGRVLPDYTQAVRGSIRFYNGRLDKPENGFWYYFAVRYFQPIDRTLFIRKLNDSGTWVIGGTVWDDSPREKGTVPTHHPTVNSAIIHNAVSFIPIDPQTGKPGGRAHVLLNDLELIQWKPYNHWLVTDSQEELDEKHGRVY